MEFYLYLTVWHITAYAETYPGDDPCGKEHGPVVGDLPQKMIFPELNGDPVTDSIIDKCWHGD
jgi:hypothetical protein